MIDHSMRIKARVKSGNQWSAMTDAYFDTSTPMSVPDLKSDIFRINGNYPNPFTNQTTIAYWLPEAGNTRIVFYQYDGRYVYLYELNNQKKGENIFIWYPVKLSPGIYFYKIIFKNHTVSGKLLKNN